MAPAARRAPDALGVSAILLAAGESRRMGAANKLLLEVAGRPMVRRAAETLLASRVDEVVVVLGHERARVTAALAGLALRPVVNAAYRAGQMSSVAAGAAAVDRRAGAVLVCLADQPLLEPADIDFLIDAFAARASGSILVPTVAGRRGNPIVLAGTHLAALAAGGVDFGCRRLIARHPDLVVTVAAPNDHFLADIDTPEAFSALSARAAPPRD